MAAAAKLDDNTVVQEFERGWIMHDRVLRAAKVTLALPAEQDQDAPAESQGDA